MPQVTEPVFETVKKEVQRYKCDKCGYVGEGDEFSLSKQYHGVQENGHYEELYYCETCDGSGAVAKKEAKLESLASRINKTKSGVIAASGFVSWILVALWSSSVSSWNMFTSLDGVGFGALFGHFIGMIILWGIFTMAYLFVLAIVMGIARNFDFIEQE